jgi:hypothetical protein
MSSKWSLSFDLKRILSKSFYTHLTLTSVPYKLTDYDDNKTLFCAHTHKVLTMTCLAARHISSALCATILGIPVAGEHRIFHNLELFFIIHDVCVGCKLIDLQES